MIIGLFGFSFEDRNKGCEALTYSFISMLEKIVGSDLTIINLSGIGIEKVRDKYPNIKFEMVGFQKNKICFKSFISLLRCDYIFDCTFGDNFSDIYSLKFVSRTTNYKEMTLLLRKKLVLTPQTIGPFKNEKLKKRVVKVLKKSDLVFTRDAMSSEYVKELTGVDPITVTDLAFMLPYKKDNAIKNSEKINIGINVSGLLWKGGFDRKNQFSLSVNYKEYIEKILQYLENNEKYCVHLIPHVLSEDSDEIDEDYQVCKELSERFDIKLAGYFNDPIEAKSYISCMDIFIGARMHSTIAAFSTDVVTIPFSYSRKFEGLFNSLGYFFTINGRELTTQEAVEKTLSYIQNPAELHISQQDAMQIINKLENQFISIISEYLAAPK